MIANLLKRYILVSLLTLKLFMMILKLHNKLCFAALGLLFLGTQAVSAQGYQGVPYTNPFADGLPLEIGTAVGVGDNIQLELYDAMPGDAAGPGANTLNANPGNGVPGTYFDRSEDGSVQPSEENGKSNFRLGTDVDITDRTDPSNNAPIIVLTGNQGNEYQFFTINVLTTGMYTIKVRYSHTSPDDNKKMQVFRYDPADLSDWVGGALMNSSGSGANPPNFEPTYNIDELAPGELPPYGFSQETTPFELIEGSRLFRVRMLSAGWQVDYITFTLQETLSTEEVSLRNSLKVYPNPSKTGQFQLSLDSDWKVYSLLGAKVLEGSGNTVDLNSAGVNRGTYILKTPHVTKKVIFN